MIARMWHRKVRSAKAATHREFVHGRPLSDCASVPDDVSVHLLERADGDITLLFTLTFWKNLNALRAFAGEEARSAEYHQEDSGSLLKLESRVLHGVAG